MSDFLTRLAGRAVGQVPLLEPLVPAWLAPLEAAAAVENVGAPAMLAAQVRAAHPIEASSSDGPRVWHARESRAPALAAPAMAFGVVAQARSNGQEASEPSAVAVVAAVAPHMESTGAGLKRPGAESSAAVTAGTSDDVRPAPARVGAAMADAPAARRSAPPALAQRAESPRGAVETSTAKTMTSMPMSTSISASTSASASRLRASLQPESPRRTEGVGDDLARDEGARRLQAIAAEGPAVRQRVEMPGQTASITVSIGRIEVRAPRADPRSQTPAPAPSSPRTRARPRVSLDEYLAQRSRDAR